MQVKYASSTLGGTALARRLADEWKQRHVGFLQGPDG